MNDIPSYTPVQHHTQDLVRLGGNLLFNVVSGKSGEEAQSLERNLRHTFTMNRKRKRSTDGDSSTASAEYEERPRFQRLKDALVRPQFLLLDLCVLVYEFARPPSTGEAVWLNDLDLDDPEHWQMKRRRSVGLLSHYRFYENVGNGRILQMNGQIDLPLEISPWPNRADFGLRVTDERTIQQWAELQCQLQLFARDAISAEFPGQLDPDLIVLKPLFTVKNAQGTKGVDNAPIHFKWPIKANRGGIWTTTFKTKNTPPAEQTDELRSDAFTPDAVDFDPWSLQKGTPVSVLFQLQRVIVPTDSFLTDELCRVILGINVLSVWRYSSVNS